MHRLLIVVIVSIFAAIAVSPAQAAPSCHFVLGFAAYHAAHAAEVGDCLDDESHDGTGDGWQHTTNGYLVWRKATNTVTFYADLSYLHRVSARAQAPTATRELHRCSIPDDPAWPCHVALSPFPDMGR